MQNTTETEPLKVHCPTCKKIVLWNDQFPFKPFCSDRCRLIDLGEWANENHRITGDAQEPNKDDDYDDN